MGLVANFSVGVKTEKIIPTSLKNEPSVSPEIASYAAGMPNMLIVLTPALCI